MTRIEILKIKRDAKNCILVSIFGNTGEKFSDSLYARQKNISACISRKLDQKYTNGVKSYGYYSR